MPSRFLYGATQESMGDPDRLATDSILPQRPLMIAINHPGRVAICEHWGQHSSHYEVGRSLCSQRVPSENCTARSMGMFIAMRTVG